VSPQDLLKRLQCNQDVFRRYHRKPGPGKFAAPLALKVLKEAGLSGITPLQQKLQLLKTRNISSGPQKEFGEERKLFGKKTRGDKAYTTGLQCYRRHRGRKALPGRPRVVRHWYPREKGSEKKVPR